MKAALAAAERPGGARPLGVSYFAAQRLGLTGVLVSSIAQNGIDHTKSADIAPGTICTPTAGIAAGAHGPPIFVVQYHSP